VIWGIPLFCVWVKEKLSGVSKTSTQPQSMGRAEVDNKVGEEVVRDRRKVLAKKSNPGAKPARIRSNNQSKTSRKSTGKAVRASTVKSKAKGKSLQKG
jgi:hypothetical protein